MWEWIKSQSIYFWYYFDIQFRQIFIYWVIGIIIGSIISVFAKDKINKLFEKIQDKKLGIFGIFIASILGILSPLCMYGTIPIAASFSKNGMRDDMIRSIYDEFYIIKSTIINL